MRLAKCTRNALLGALALTLAPTAALATTADTTYEERDNDTST